MITNRCLHKLCNLYSNFIFILNKVITTEPAQLFKHT